MSSPSSSPSGTPAGASPPSNSTTVTSTPAPPLATPSSTSASPASSLSPPPVYSPPPVSASAPSPSSPSTTTSPPPPPSSLVVSPPPPKSFTPSSSTSPPPPPISASPPPPAAKSSPTSTSSSSSSSSSISGSTLAAIGVAAVLAISVIAVLLYCLCKKKKKKQYYQGDHHGPPGAPPAHYKDPYNFPNTRQQELFSPSSYGSDIQFKMPPPPPVPPSLPSPGNGYDSIPLAPSSDGTRYPGNSKPWFTYEQLATATDGFSRSNMLGEGGFGCVYKGVLSDGGQLVAVKQLKVGASQGEKEFQAEVEIISRVHHRHLVSLVGYCIAGSQRLLVYDYVPNGTLEYHLHNRKGGPVMDWATRIKIACGAARGLAYLHEDCHPRIIHRDIKSSNILLDNNFEAQVSDFGLAKLSSDTNTHVTTRVMGTFGYLAPEYASSGKLTEKSDVFSFGVVLLELLTGQKPVDPSRPLGEESLVEWARPVLAQVNSEEDLKMVADPSLNGAYDPKEMMQMVEAAAACVRHSANKRPRMGQVVRALEDETSLSDLNKGLKPGHSSVYGSSFTSSDYDNGSYSADMRRFRRVALGSQEYGSEYSGATSESGVNPSTSNSDYQTSREIDRNLSRLTKPVSVRTNIQASSSNEFSTSN